MYSEIRGVVVERSQFVGSDLELEAKDGTPVTENRGGLERM
jgi:hypothetical protein